ncbi:hypothetical protein BJ944DRAFT_244505 [Cunninghamella echinulata]|nr:hypothetical protein BJ944DRAFT_244505 [Cunninghamella echinulata]
MVIVDCQWPCSNPNDACIITNSSIKCQLKKDSQWIWIDPTRSPEYDGEPAHKDEPCITLPLPQLPTYSFLNKSTQTEVTWPPIDLFQPSDTFLSDCDPQNYCSIGSGGSSQGICLSKLNLGQPCQSTNQCMEKSICQHNKCIFFDKSSSSSSSTNTNTPSSSSSSNNTNNNNDSSLLATLENDNKTIEIIIGVLVSVLVITLALLAWVIYKKWKYINISKRKNTSSSPSDPTAIITAMEENYHHKENNNHTLSPSSFQDVSLPSSQIQDHSSHHHDPSASLVDNNNNNNTIVNNSNHQLHHESSSIMTTPSMQQQQLQIRLQNQSPYTNNPPPYHP